MLNFASLFNQYRSGGYNSINELLNQQDITLDRLLDEDSFLNQIKSGNSKLLQFLKYDKIQQLIDYITIQGPADDKRRSYKFPLTASDVLSSDNNSFLQWFLPEDKIYQEKKYIEQQEIQVQDDQQQQQHHQQNQSKNHQQNAQIIQNGNQNGNQNGKQNHQKTIINDTLDGSQVVENSVQKQQTLEVEKKDDENVKENNDGIQTENKIKKKIKKVIQVQKTQHLQVQPLIFYLFKYFEGEVNYILTGYVCKVLTFLFTKRGNKMMEFLFKGRNIDKMIKHIESRSVGEFLLKIMTVESNSFALERAEFFKSLFIKIAQQKEIHVLSNFSSFISQTIQKAAANIKGTNPVPQFPLIFFTPQVITLVIKNVMSDQQNVSVYNSPILLTYLINVPFTLPQDENIINQFKQLLRMFIEKSLEKLERHDSRPKLGFGRVKIIQILTFILKENLLGSRQIFGAQKNSFQILFNLCKKYQMNNVLHNQIVKIISIAFSDKQQSSLCKALSQNDILLNFLIFEAEQDEIIRTGKNHRKHRKGYIGHIVQICRLVQQYALQKNNLIAKEIFEREQFQIILQSLVQKQIFQNNKSLAGYRMFKKSSKNEIMFQKEDIISHYFEFLTHSPKPVFEPQPQHINIQHPDFVEQLERQIQQSMTIQDIVPVVQNTQHQKSNSAVPNADRNLQVVEIQMHVNFFKGHLEYDVEDLMEEL